MYITKALTCLILLIPDILSNYCYYQSVGLISCAYASKLLQITIYDTTSLLSNLDCQIC